MQADQREDKNRLDREIPIAADIDAVASHGIETEQFGRVMPIDWQAGTGNSGSAEGADVDSSSTVGHASSVPFEFLDVGEPVMRGQDRLGALEMRVGWNDDTRIAIAAAEERALQFDEQLVDSIDGVPNPQSQIGRDLIVAGSAGVEFATDIAQGFDERVLDVHVDIFEFDAERELASIEPGFDGLQFPLDGFEFVRGEQSLTAQHGGMRDRASDIVLVEPVIVGDALAETGQGIVHGIGEYAAAGWGSHGNNLSRGGIVKSMRHGSKSWGLFWLVRHRTTDVSDVENADPREIEK